MNIYPTPNGDHELGDFPSRKDEGWCNVIWIITEHCNLGCHYCIGWKHTGTATSLVDKIGVDRLVDAFKKLRDEQGKQLYLTITGGEPTIVRDFPMLCKKLANEGFVIELQSNLISEHVKEFVDSVDPKSVGQIMASYHGWALDKGGRLQDNSSERLQDRYMENFRHATEQGFTCVLKTIVLPNEVDTIGKKVARLKKLIPVGAPLLTWPYIKGQEYPYAYTAEQKKIIFKTAEYRSCCQKHYMDGAGYYQGMKCDAGRGFIVIDRNGRASRCYTSRGVSIGNLVIGNIRLNDEPKVCTAGWCETAFWGMWFGRDPWNYVKGSKRENAYFCRFGPEV